MAVSQTLPPQVPPVDRRSSAQAAERLSRTWTPAGGAR